MDTARERGKWADVQGMNWNRLTPPKHFHTWFLVLASFALLSLAAFDLGGRGIGMAVTGALVFALAYLSRVDEPAGQARNS